MMSQNMTVWGILASLLNYSLTIYFWIVIAAVLISWIPLDPYNPTAKSILRFLRQATEPTFRFFRRTLHLQRYTSPFDFTPWVVILAIAFLRIFLVQTVLDLNLLTNPVVFSRCMISNLLVAILATIAEILGFYLWVVIVAFIIAFLPLDPYNPFAQAIVKFLRQATEPIFRWLRRTLQLYRYIKTVDFISPLLLILAILLVQALVQSLAQQAQLLRMTTPGFF
jgi:YggT family protein